MTLTAPLRYLWWKFRGMWCVPFGHVIYLPHDRWNWECACGDMRIGRGFFGHYWQRFRRPSDACPEWDTTHQIFREAMETDRVTDGYNLHAHCPTCHGRLWVRT